MKKLQLILVLVFSYFVCISSVFAWCDVDNQSDPISSVCRPFGFTYRNYTKYFGVSSLSESSYSELIEPASDNWEYIDNYNLFGTYSDNRIIPYIKPQFTSYDNTYALLFTYTQEASIDENGNAYWFKGYQATEYVDLDFGSLGANYGVPYNNVFRIDFSIHINFNTIPSEVRNTIFSGLLVDPSPTSSGNGYCASKYDFEHERIDISCSGINDNSHFIVRLLNNNPLDFKLNNSVVSYSYHCYFDISQTTVLTPATTTGAIEDLDTNMSPGGSYFDDYYNILQKNSSYFSSVALPSFNGLTQIVASPLAFINSIGTTIPVDTTLDITLFTRTISIPNGCYLFWCKQARNFRNWSVGSFTFTRSQQWNYYNSFRTFWYYFFGGWLVYLSLRYAFRVSMKLINPDNSQVEVF